MFNGDVGTIDGLAARNSELTVLFEGRAVIYGWGELDNLVPAYACTTHKCQGSESAAVVYGLADAGLRHAAAQSGGPEESNGHGRQESPGSQALHQVG